MVVGKACFDSVTGTRDGAETRAEVDWWSSGMLFVGAHMRSFVKNTYVAALPPATGRVGEAIFVVSKQEPVTGGMRTRTTHIFVPDTS